MGFATWKKIMILPFIIPDINDVEKLIFCKIYSLRFKPDIPEFTYNMNESYPTDNDVVLRDLYRITQLMIINHSYNYNHIFDLKSIDSFLAEIPECLSKHNDILSNVRFHEDYMLPLSVNERLYALYQKDDLDTWIATLNSHIYTRFLSTAKNDPRLLEAFLSVFNYNSFKINCDVVKVTLDR